MNNRVKELRKHLKMSQEQFGYRLGVTKTAISNIESGSRGVTSQMRTAIIREFHVNEVWLDTGEGEMFLQQSDDEILVALFDEIMTEGPEDEVRAFVTHFAKLSPEKRHAFAAVIIGMAGGKA